MQFTLREKVKFKHCDPAGIVFYPRYFEMINDMVEAFFDDGVGVPFEDLHREGGIPTAEISVKFARPSRHGDRLDIALQCYHLGRTSLGIEVRATCQGEERFLSRSTLVLVDSAGRPRPWSDTIRARLSEYLSKRAA
ncbi:MAG: thioesterase family protein [Sulfitobacter sp.]|nr:thioesterase family protein [Sulfitobacter sp.]